MIPINLELSTSKVLLRPLKHEDFTGFIQLTSNDNENDVWKYFSRNLSDEQQLIDWIATAYKERALEIRRPFTIIDKGTGEIAGSTSFGNISYYDKRAEIGWSWLGAPYRGTDINIHAKFCLLQFAFEIMELERIEFKTGVKNERARKGLLKLGAKEEGTLRSHMLLWNGDRRTSVIYSILKEEWNQLKETIFKEIK